MEDISGFCNLILLTFCRTNTGQLIGPWSWCVSERGLKTPSPAAGKLPWHHAPHARTHAGRHTRRHAHG